MKAIFVRYTPPENKALKFCVKIEPEPDGDYSIISGSIQEKRGEKIAASEFEGGWFSHLLRELKVDEAEFRIAIELAIENRQEEIL